MRFIRLAAFVLLAIQTVQSAFCAEVCIGRATAPVCCCGVSTPPVSQPRPCTCARTWPISVNPVIISANGVPIAHKAFSYQICQSEPIPQVRDCHSRSYGWTAGAGCRRHISRMNC